MPVFAQTSRPSTDRILAKIGTEVITTGDLLNRLETMPFPGRIDAYNLDSVKSKALYAMVAERLLALQAREMGIGADSSTNRELRALEKVLVCNELYRRQVVEKVAIGEDEIEQGLNRITKKIEVISFLTRNESEGKKLAERLQNKGLKELLQKQAPSLYTQHDTIEIGFPSADIAFEDAAYAIGNSRTSPPFFSSNFGWVVLYLLDRRTNPDPLKMGFAERRRTVARILKERREQSLAGKYYSEVLEPRHAVADSAMFSMFAEAVSGLWKPDTMRFRVKGGYRITSDQIDVLTASLRPSLEKPFVTGDEEAISLGDVIELFRYQNFATPVADGPVFKLALNAAVKTVVAVDLLAREGERQQLQNSESVRNDIRLWSENWRAGALLHFVRDTVQIKDDEIVQYLIRNREQYGKRYEVNVLEVLCASLNDLSKVTEEIKRGRSFSDIARRYTTRSEWMNNGGESRYFPVGRHPDIGFAALLVGTGTIVGPLHLAEGYSVFEVLGKRKVTPGFVGFDTLAQNIRARLLEEKKREATDKFIADLARKHRVTFDDRALKSVKTSSIPMFTRRYLGFGGVMSAAPLIMQQWSWMNEYLKPTEALP